MKYFHLKNGGRMFGMWVVIFVLSIILVSCEGKINICQVEANYCGAKTLYLKRDETFRVLIYSNGLVLGARSRSNLAMPQQEIRCNGELVKHVINSDPFNYNRMSFYEVKFLNFKGILCNLTISVSDPEDSIGFQNSMLYLCITIGVLFVLVFIVETFLIVYYKKKYTFEMLRGKSAKDNYIESKERKRYSSPPDKRRLSNKNNSASDIYEVLEQNMEKNTSVPTPPANHNSFRRIRPRLPMPSIVKPQRFPHSTNTIPKTRPRLPTPCEVMTQGDYEEMDNDLLLTSKKFMRESNVGQPAKVVMSELNGKLAKKPGPPTRPKASRLLVTNGTPREVAPPVPKTPRPKREDLERTRASGPTQDTLNTGITITNSALSSDEEWDSYEDLEKYPIYNI